MRLKSLVGVGICAVTAALAASVVLDNTVRIERDDGSTLALSPFSLGNPAAAATLTTRRLAEPQSVDGPVAAKAEVRVPKKIRSGDTLAVLLRRAGVPGQEAEAAIRAFKDVYDPKRLRIGQTIDVQFEATLSAGTTEPKSKAERFLGFAFSPNKRKDVLVSRTDEGVFQADEVKKKLKAQPVRIKGQIDSSLFLAGSKAGLPISALTELVRIYSWDVDFQRDIRKGDQFEVLYEEVRDETGSFVEVGKIKYAALTLSGDKKPLYWFKTDDGLDDYFDDTGRGAKKALMRTPIDGARLSSGFGKRRHPILGYNKLHKGVDFAAPRGTPIYAAGDGVVEVAGRKGSFGKYVRIRHNGSYKTAYAHMKGFGRGIRSGKRVRQGQVIGYVGTTGRSTGPHLHYEVHKNGRAVNPMRVKMPSGKKLKGQELDRFMTAKLQIQGQFAELGRQQQAALDAR